MLLLNELDEMVAKVVGGFEKRGMWNNTLLLFHSDNGGELVFDSACEEAASSSDSSSSIFSSVPEPLPTSANYGSRGSIGRDIGTGFKVRDS